MDCDEQDSQPTVNSIYGIKKIMLIRCSKKCESHIRTLIRGISGTSVVSQMKIPDFSEPELKDTSSMLKVDRTKRIFLTSGEIYQKKKNKRKRHGDVEESPTKSTPAKSSWGINPTLLSVLKSEKAVPTTADTIGSSDKTSIAPSDLQTNIEYYLPVENTVGSSKYENISKGLSKAFTKRQLKEYVDEMKKKPEFHHVVYRKVKGKRVVIKEDYIDTILLDIWKLTKTEGQLVTDVFERKTVPVTKPQQYLLHPERSSLFSELKALGVSVEMKNGALHMSGTQTSLDIAEHRIKNTISGFERKEIDLSHLAEQFNKAGRAALLFKYVQETLHVYFQHIEDGKYIIHAEYMGSIDLAKQLLIWALDFNPHIVNEIYNKHELFNHKFIPVSNDESLAWVEKSTNSFYQQMKDFKTPTNPLLVSKLSKMRDPIVESNVLNELVDQKALERKAMEEKALKELSGISSLFKEETDNFGMDEFEKLSLNDELSQSKEETDQLVTKEHVSLSSEDELLTTDMTEESSKEDGFEFDEEPLTVELSDYFSDSAVDNLYEQLNDTSYAARLKGVPGDAILSKAITAQFGNILLKSEKSDELFPKFETVTAESEFKFVSNGIPYISDIITSLPSAAESVDIPYTTKVQIRFAPSLFHTSEGSTKSVKEYLDYPPVEIQADINTFGVPNPETMLVYTAEAVKNIAIPFPKAACDVQLSKVIAGDLLKIDHESSEQEVSDEEISSSSRRFKNQPDLPRYLEESNLKFKGDKKLSCKPSIDININGEKVRYDFVNVTHRTEIPFLFRDRIITLAIVEGGEFGGRRTEIVMGEGELSKEEFQWFLTDVAQLLQSAS
ncbi:uncharacterized protein SPAPADRAFT_52221 [Spathaspora passalidarum NRRL Y-27907]|uniref:Uncharacterized protein n=1 Tax=Spathaspora passalidarum (strain NRRL Y-27907 / 11-Y1) TaxID=619300 RepID=G3AS79_SPAPN|nr:uncharacterized protein SPAPADRAFT_52221 [Spathaspora passalidarum NRRL Y-27907]EGW31038.1 hypothetical protein SPAPADRAFT_52221 [Spathaspora passalidarum NRRL Y-27907]